LFDRPIVTSPYGRGEPTSDEEASRVLEIGVEELKGKVLFRVDLPVILTDHPAGLRDRGRLWRRAG